MTEAHELLQISQRYAGLSPDLRRAFKARLAASRFDVSRLPIVRLAEDSTAIPLSYSQERLWFLWRLDSSSAAYNVSGAVRLTGRLNVEALRGALDALMLRHEVLRTRFVEIDGVPHQLIDDAPSYDWLTGIVEGGEAELRSRLRHAFTTPFHLERGPLFRVVLLRAGEHEHVLALTVHHIVSDGRSVLILMQELVRLYDSTSGSPPLPPLPIQYRDYAIWQREWQDEVALERQLDYWRVRLGSAYTAPELPLDRPRPALRSPIGARVARTITRDVAERLRSLARSNGATLFMLLLAVFDVLLFRYTGQMDVRVGIPAANRRRQETDGLIGFFVNTLVIRAELSGSIPFNSLLAQIRERVLEAQANQDIPFEKLVAALKPERQSGRTPFFDVLFGLQHVDAPPLTTVANLTVAPIIEDSGTTQFDLTVDAVEQAGLLDISFGYACDLFDSATVERLSDHYVEILEALSRAGDGVRLGAIGLDVGAPARPVTYAFVPVPERLAAQAAAQAEVEAVSCGEDRVSYAGLDAWSNRIGRRLKRLGVSGDVRVGLCVERSVGLAAGLIGVLKSGGAFVPLDPSYPEARLREMIEDAGVRHVVADAVSAVRLSAVLSGCAVVIVSDVSDEPDAGWTESLHPDQLAYVIYTSGSTGRPKGVAISHRALSLHMEDFIGTYAIAATDRVLQSSTVNFDVALHELLPALIMGGRVVMRGPQAWDLESLNGVLLREAVTFARIPTALWQQWLGALPDSLPALRQVTVGGEALPGVALKRWQAGSLSTIRLDNLYGPTETTVASLFHRTRAMDAEQGIVPIGLPYPGRSAAVIDADGNRVPAGGLGELCVGGVSLARGYLGRPGLTAERFVPDPYGAPGSRLYRTGDLCRERVDGTVEYLGRLDQQVKLRGYRIELGEIEAALRNCAGVCDAVVALQGAGPAARLVGFVVGESDLTALSEALGRRLPAYMVPTRLVRLDALPVMPNGKIDRNALPAVDLDDTPRQHIAPRTATEARLCEIFAEVLGVERVGASDDFFALGGHSLLAVRAVSRIRSALQREVPLSLLFEHPVVASLASALSEASPETAVAIRPRPDGMTRVALSPGQERLWFLWRLDPSSAAYNVAGAIRLEGMLDVDALKAALRGLVERHESLRTRFGESDGIAWQEIEADPRYGWIEHDLRSAPASALDACLRDCAAAPFDLEQGPLLRLVLARQAADVHVLGLTMHHIVSDGWSASVLVRELVALYDAARHGGAAALPALPIQYADYALWQRQRLDSGVSAAQLDYWRGRLGEEHPVLELPADRMRTGARSAAGGRVVRQLPAEVTARLKQLSQAQGATLFMTLLAAYDVLLYRYSGQADLRVGVPVANRDRLETEGLIGFLVNTLVIRTELSGAHSFKTLLAQVRSRMIEAHDNQDIPFEKLVAELQPERDVRHTPLFQTLFNLQHDDLSEPDDTGMMVSAVELEGSTTQFDLILDVAEEADALRLSFRYARDLFDATTIEQVADHYVELLQQLDGDIRIDEVLLTVEAPLAPLMTYPFRSVLERIAEQAARRAEAEAVSCGEERLSYAALAEWSNRIGRRLKRLGVSDEARVGLCVERSTGLVAGLLGVLKAGGAYVPLDPSYPEARLRETAADAGLRWVVTDSANAERVRSLLADCRVVVVSEVDDEAADDWSEPLHPDQLAYVIYTSGSTGRPKGVGVTHANLSRLLDATADWYRFGTDDVWTLFHSHAFDFSVWELFGGLTHGGRLVVVPYWTARHSEAFVDLLRREEVTVLNQTPSAFEPLMAAEQASGAPVESLRAVIFGGEKLEPSRLAGWLGWRGEKAPRLINMYGITETTVHVSYRPLVFADTQGAARSLIGEPIPDLSLQVLDGGLHPVPEGGIGEIHVGGAGLARGYLGRPALTAERFVPDPHGVPGSRLYRSGDLARRLAGDVEYLGRGDQQVKLRGHRIELGEIEVQLLAIDGVHAAAVLAVAGRLVAYVVGDADAEVLRTRLSEALPSYMVPAGFVSVETLPLTVNGKLDRAALSALSVPSETRRRDCIAPRTPAEACLVEIWQSVLGRLDIGVADNFFALGGDSILSLQVIARARAAGLYLTPRLLFERPTIAQLVQAALTVDAARDKEITEPLPLTPIQAWFFERNPDAPSHWNQSVLLKVTERLDMAALKEVLRALVARHDALRLHFTQQDGVWRQQVAPIAQDDILEIVDLTGASDWVGDLENEGTRLQTSLDLSSGRLLKVGYFRCPHGDGRLLISIHHLAVDGISWRVLLEDLQQAYQQAIRGEVITLPRVGLSWSGWVERQRSYAAVKPLTEVTWWQSALAEADPSLPVDGDGDRRLAMTRSIVWRLDDAATSRLLREAPRPYRMRIDEILLTALVQAVSAWSGRNGVLLELEGHGREDIIPGLDLSRTLGWFTTRYPVWVSAVSDAAAALKSVKERLRTVPVRGLHWGMLDYHEDTEVRELIRRLPRPTVSFNYLGQFVSTPAPSDGFSFAPEFAGRSVSGEGHAVHILDVTGHIVEGSLSLSWRYSPGELNEATVRALVELFESRLKALVEYCLAAEPGATASDFPLSGLVQDDIEQLDLPWGDIEDIYPATPLQQGLLFHSLLQSGRGVYVNQLRLTLSGTLDRVALKGAWQAAIERHAVLRTSFEWRHGRAALQVVRRSVPLPYVEHDWSATPEWRVRLSAWMTEDVARGFDLADAPLMRLALIARHDGLHELIWTNHHVLTDGWSTAQLLREIIADYEARVRGTVAALPVQAQYRDYFAWLAHQPNAEPWWREQLAAVFEPAMPVASLGQPLRIEAGPHQLHRAFDVSFVERLQSTAQRYRVTLNTIMQAGWALLIARYGGRRQVVFGVTVSGRPAELVGADRVIGLFINTLPLWVDVPGHAVLDDWLSALQDKNSALRQYEHTSLSELQHWAGLSGDALFDTLFVFENYPVETVPEGQSSTVQIIGVELTDRTHYPLSLTVLPRTGLELEWDWDGERVAREAVERLSDHYVEILEALSRAGDGVRLGAIGLDVGAPARPVTYAFVPVPERLAAQAAAQAEVEAVSCGEDRVSYAGLDAWSNRIGRRLKRLGVSGDVRVGLCVERSVGLAAGLIGVLKSGGAFVPLDPSYPEARLREMIEDAGVRHVVADAVSAVRLSAVLSGCAVVIVSDVSDEPDAGWTESLHPDQLAYVIYTSGSTGRPKGVAISHRALSLHMEDFIGTYAIAATDRVLQSSTVNFDVALHELLPALIMGGRVVMRGPQAWDLESLNGVLLREAVTFARIPTALWQQWLGALPDSLPALRQVTVGGEALPGVALKRWQAGSLSTIRLDNLYGPTETTVASLFHRTRAMDAEQGIVPIGLPYPGRSAAVIDADGNRVPAGGLGELCVGGVSLARGYLGRPGLTAERFVPDPYGAPGSRLYRTGDLCRERVDGTVEYLGRLDQQVKLRGYRIELGEIEAALRNCAGVCDAVVALQGAGPAARLVGFVVGESDLTALSEALGRRLPAYMVPTRLVRLDALPVMPNGKIDRNALPAVDLDDTPRQHIAPRTATEARLAEICRTVLKHDDIGVTDDFFERGGNSLSALGVAALARKAGLHRFSLEALFAHRTIEALATVIDSAPGDYPANILLLNSPAAADTAIFCVHPAYGLVSEYRPLALALDGIAKVYGVQSPGFAEPDWCPENLEALAREYVRRVRRVQPDGPYRLLGWSLGGLIAIAMADALTQAGELVTFVGLVDALPSGVVEPADMVPMSEEMEVAAVLDELARRIPDYPLMSAERAMTAGRVVAIGRLHRSLFRRYRLPEKLAVGLSAWWAQRRLARGGPDARWAAFTTGDVEVVDYVDADHADIISHPAFLAGMRAHFFEHLSLKSGAAVLAVDRGDSRS